MISKARNGEFLPIYSKGDQVSAWLHVRITRPLRTVLERGASGRTYKIGDHNARQKIEMVKTLRARCLTSFARGAAGRSHAEQMTEAAVRLWHDKRFAIDASRNNKELCLTPAEMFELGIPVGWDIANDARWGPLVAAKAAKAAKAAERSGVAA